MAIARAVPAGSRRPPRKPGFQPAYLAALAKDPELAALRGDFRHNVMELARIYARHANWQDMTTWRPRDEICAEIGSPRDRSRPLSVTAYRAARRWLQEHGYLGLVAGGWTSALRAAVLDDGDQLCPVYVLTIPRIPKTRHIPPPRIPVPPVNRALTTSRSVVVKAPTHTRGHPGEDQDQNQNGPRSARAACPCPAELGAMSKIQKRSEARATAAMILERCRPLRPLTAEHVAAVIRPWTAAGWASGDVLWAVGHQPPDWAGRCRPHGWTDDVRHPAAWLRWRLSRWASPDGAPLPAPSRRDAAERARVRADQHARHAQRQQAAQARAAAGGDVDARGAARARQALARRGLPAQAGLPRTNGRSGHPASSAAPLVPAPPQDRAGLRQALLARLNATALARAQRHRVTTAARLAGPAAATAVRDQTAPLIARADAQAARQQHEHADPGTPARPDTDAGTRPDAPAGEHAS
jgi:hypothetical protein